MRKILLMTLIFAVPIFADPPWSTNVRVSVETPWDTLNQGESCFTLLGDSIFSTAILLSGVMSR